MWPRSGDRPGRGAARRDDRRGLEDAEFAIPGQIVADIALAEPPVPQPDGSILVTIEALTVGE